MANIYVDSAAAGLNNGTSWANAYTSFNTAIGTVTNADTVWLKSTHAEGSASNLAFNCPTSPGLRILCAGDASEPPTSLGTGALVDTTGSLAFNGYLYCYGVTFKNVFADLALNSTFVGTGHGMRFESCTFWLNRSTGAQRLLVGYLGHSSNGSADFRLWDCTVRFAHTGSTITPRCGQTIITGLTIDSAGSTPTTLFSLSNSGAESSAIIEGCDLSSETFTNLIGVNTDTNGSCIVRNCKLPASVTLVSGTYDQPGMPEVQIMNCDDGDTQYVLYFAQYAGTVAEETTIVRTGGASQSRKMVSNANALFPSYPLRGPEIVRYNSTVGSSITVTLEFVHDSATALKNDEFWIDVQYQGTSGFPLALFASSAKADVLATAADTTDSSESWTTTGMSNPNTRKCTVTFTPQEAGYLYVVPHLAKASTTVYYDPEIAVS